MAKQAELRQSFPVFLAELERDGVVCEGLKNELRSDSQSEWASEEECLFVVLRQAIDFHIRGELNFALRLLKWLIDHGPAHALVLDNFIRVLVDSERFCEALACLPRLEALDQAEILDGARQCLQPHAQSILSNIRRHISEADIGSSEQRKLDEIPLVDIYYGLLLFASRQLEAGQSLLSMAVLGELSNWGVWNLNALSEEAKRSWALLVVRLGSDLFKDLDGYRSALSCLQDFMCEEALWQLRLVDVALLKDRSEEDQAQNLVLQFLCDHPNHREARTWLAEQQLVKIRADLRESVELSVRTVDQAYVRDSLILDYFLKLIDSEVLMPSGS